MKKIYSAESLKNAEKAYDGIDLMNNAANAVLSATIPHLNGDALTIICGVGNNGGDGWAVASIIEDYPVNIIYIDEPKTAESIHYRKKVQKNAVSASSPEAVDIIKNSKIILDCIFGIGLSRPPEGIYKKVIDLVNESGAFVVSVDIPSGISSDSCEMHPHIKADKTVCITSKKLSGVIQPTKEAFGDIMVCDIGVSMKNEAPVALISDDEVLRTLPPRFENSNKGTYGTLKTLCGSYNMPGAGILSITSALRTGVGLVKVFGHNDLLNIYKNRLSEPVFRDFSPLGFINEKATAALIGCGIGTEYDNVLAEILQKLTCPLILDADGINFLSRNIDICEHISANMILTPHPGEMARLCNTTVESIQENRLVFCREISEKLHCTVVLKGAGTIICTPSHTPIVNTTGNSGLAKGGSGDVLAGMIGSFVAQGMAPHEACTLGVYLHGAAADSLKRKFSEYSFLPSDIPIEAGKIIAEKLHQN